MMTNNTVYVTRKFNCSAKTLFKWIVEPEFISKWFGPKDFSVGVIQRDLKVGGDYKIELIKSDSTSFFVVGTYLEIDDRKCLKFSFSYSGLTKHRPKSIVHLTLKELDPLATELTLIQKFETTPDGIENKTKGWEYMFKKLSKIIK